MTVLPLGDVRSHLSEIVGRVHDHHERVTVTVHGEPSAPGAVSDGSADDPYELRTTSTVRRALSETLPEAVATAA
jgi:antitoxin (DNA-binding transcriptional repressor) of toxin-antitoxin stability system